MPSEHRLHPLSFLFTIGSNLSGLVFPALVVWWAAGSSRWEFWLILLAIPYTAYGLVRYFTYRYVFDTTDLIIRTGFLFRNERHIPYARIHNIGVVQNLFHRLLGVVEVRLETAGGQEPEARIQVLSVAAMEEMRRHVHQQRSRTAVADAEPTGPVPEASTEPAAPAEPARRTLLRLPLREVLLYGIIDNRGMIVVGAALGLAWELGWLDFEDKMGRFGDTVSAAGKAATPLQVGLVVLAGVILLLVALRLFSIGWAFLRLFDFRLERSARDLTTSSGLFTRVTATLPLHRVQVLTIREKPLYRLVGRAEVQVETAGGQEPSGALKFQQQRLAPLISTEALPALLEEVHPGVNLDQVSWQKVDPRARRRIFNRSMLLILLVGGLASPMVGLWALAIPAVLAPLALLNAWQQARHMGYAVSEDAVLYRSGWLSRKLSMARLSKIQTVSLGESPFDRRYRMARLQVDTAGASVASHRIHVPYLDRGIARRLFDSLGTAAAHTAFRW